MVDLHKTVELQVWYKNPVEGEWIIKVRSGKKRDSDIADILTQIWTESTVPLNSPMYVIQPNWAGTGEPVELYSYAPFHAVTVNREHVEKRSSNG